MPQVEFYLSLSEAAVILGISIQAVRKAANAGRIAHVRVGHVVLVSAVSVAKYEPNRKGTTHEKH